MIRSSSFALIGYLALINVASAAPATFIEGTFATQAHCDALAKGGPEAENITHLTATGFQEIEWSCDFVRIDHHERLDGWVANLMCQEPGHVYPDMVTMKFIAENLLKVTFMSDEILARQGQQSTLSADYVPCPAAN